MAAASLPPSRRYDSQIDRRGAIKFRRARGIVNNMPGPAGALRGNIAIGLADDDAISINRSSLAGDFIRWIGIVWVHRLTEAQIIEVRHGPRLPKKSVSARIAVPYRISRRIRIFARNIRIPAISRAAGDLPRVVDSPGDAPAIEGLILGEKPEKRWRLTQAPQDRLALTVIVNAFADDVSLSC